jgi:hypothetical protein
MKLTIGHFYPDLLNLYGDRGNIRCMVKRLEWRGLEAEVKEYKLHDTIDFSELDIVLLGGGSDREQRLVCGELQTIKPAFQQYVEDGGVVLAICGGYQLLGSYYQIGEEKVPGLGLVELTTTQGNGRLIGNITIQSELFEQPITGFENHGGRTSIGSCTPLGKVVHGYGNADNKDYEGVIYKNVIGTYLHGPLLPKNPQLCDYLLLTALRRKYGDNVKLTKLDDSAELRANAYAQGREY